MRIFGCHSAIYQDEFGCPCKSMTDLLEAVWSVEPTRCIGCGDCAAICPVYVFTVSPPPCQAACPINTDVAAYVSLIKQGRFDEALASIREVHPFAGTLGRVCTRPCEKECARGEIDGPIAIRALKRAAAEYGQDYKKSKPSHIEVRDERVAIVGSGPAGLMAAYDLARFGYKVTVFESLPVAGGMLYVGMPEYRLPREIIKADIGQIEGLEVEIRLNTTIGKDMTLDALFEQGYRAILLATGAHRGLKLPVSGADLKGILVGTSFLKNVNLGEEVKLGERVVVLGGGNVAFDCARTALRLGASDVHIACLESRDGMPAVADEIKQAEEEGIIIHNSHTFTGIMSDDGRIIGVECLDVRYFEFDNLGKVHIDSIAGSEHILPADTVIFAIGQKPDLSFLSEKAGLNISAQGLITADADTLATSRAGIFAAGDVTGPANLIDALAEGKRAAVSIDRYLRGEDLKERREEKAEAMVREEKGIWWKEIPKSERQKIPELPIKKRSLNFKEVELSLPRASAVEEAKCCLECAIFSGMDLESCCRESCRICELQCPENAIEAY